MLFVALALAASSVRNEAGVARETPATVIAAEPPPSQGRDRVRVPVPSTDDMLTKTPEEIFGGVERQLDRRARQAALPQPSVDELVRRGLTGGHGLHSEQLNGTAAHAGFDQIKADEAEEAAAAHGQSFGSGSQGFASWLGSLAIGLAGAVSGIAGTWAFRARGKK